MPDYPQEGAMRGGHIPGALSIWLGGLPVFGGWVADKDSPVYLVTDRDADVETAAMHLARIGVDNVRGALAGGFGTWRSSGLPIRRSGTITPETLADRLDEFQLLDVRDPFNVSQAWQIELDGWLRGSRKIGDTLYLVTSYRPRLSGLVLPADTTEIREANERRIRGASGADCPIDARGADDERAVWHAESVAGVAQAHLALLL